MKNSEKNFQFSGLRDKVFNITSDIHTIYIRLINDYSYLRYQKFEYIS